VPNRPAPELDDLDATNEPDYRFTLANERTFLAWVRTGLGLFAAAVGCAHFFPAWVHPEAPRVLAILLSLIAIATVIVGLRRWMAVDYAIRRGLPLPTHRLPRFLVGSITLFGVAVVLLLIMSTAVG
jgi:putative membrane protein